MKDGYEPLRTESVCSHWNNRCLLCHSTNPTTNFSGVTSTGDSVVVSARVHPGNIKRVRVDIGLGAVGAPIAFEVLDEDSC